MPIKQTASKQIKATVTGKSSKKGNEIDFGSLDRSNINKLDAEDPSVLKQLNIDPLPDYDDLEGAQQYLKYRALFMKMLVSSSVIDSFREKLFEKLKKLQPEAASKDLGEEEDDEEEAPKKGKDSKVVTKGKKVAEDNSDKDSDEESEEEKPKAKAKAKGKEVAPLKAKPLPKKSSEEDSDVDEDSDKSEEEPPKKGNAKPKEESSEEESEEEAPKKGKVVASKGKAKKVESEEDEEAEESSEADDKEDEESEDEAPKKKTKPAAKTSVKKAPASTKNAKNSKR